MRLLSLEWGPKLRLIAHNTLFEDYGRLKSVFPIRGVSSRTVLFVNEHLQFLALGTSNRPQDGF
jgi:hypothetical protein